MNELIDLTSDHLLGDLEKIDDRDKIFGFGDNLFVNLFKEISNLDRPLWDLNISNTDITYKFKKQTCDCCGKELQPWDFKSLCYDCANRLESHFYDSGIGIFDNY
jgi:hypothetical protein